ITLDDLDAAPDDAFEVALVDATTGQSLLGGIGLANSDAILNLQADGSEHKAAGVSTVRKQDGSLSVTVDLAGIAAGTVVNLAFDLIGFGRGLAAASSQVTISSLQLGSSASPEARDDHASTAEDVALTIDVTNNDRGADPIDVSPILVDGPAHGHVMVNTDGSFSYTPQADWHGEDRFSYRLDSGGVYSNVAKVSLTVIPVNDPPTVADRSVVLDEDSEITLDLLDGVSDVDGDALGFSTGRPQHGTLVRNADSTVTYRPAADFIGEDRVVWTASDGELNTESLLRLTITAVNDTRLANDDATTIERSRSTALDLPSNDPDADGDALMPATAVPVTSTAQPAVIGAAPFVTNKAVRVSGAPGTLTTVTVRRTIAQAGDIGEIGLFRVDDPAGRIGPLAPGDPTYARAALASDRRVIVFAGGERQSSTASVRLPGGQGIGFYAIRGGSGAQWPDATAANLLDEMPLVFFSVAEANPDRSAHLRSIWQRDGKLTLAWKDQRGNGDFDDVLIDVSGITTALPAAMLEAGAGDGSADSPTARLLDGPIAAGIDAASRLLAWNVSQTGSHPFQLDIDDARGSRIEGRSVRLVTRRKRPASATAGGANDVLSTRIDWSGAKPACFTAASFEQNKWLAEFLGVEPKDRARLGLPTWEITVDR
ncbi:MAG: tandem-95 repeat protein, partial [Candidatus Accumulibacter sp.]|nr:tandem-95 repeat protein [Accumulibacter sp.]